MSGAPPHLRRSAPRALARLAGAAALAAGAAAAAACGGGAERSMDMRQWTNDLAFRIAVAPRPPVAEEVTTFTVVVQDKQTGQPIETGEGRIFATSADRAQVYNGLAKAQQPGTYTTQIRFPTAGEWAVGMQFRRDPTAQLERTQDWRQTVLPAPPLGTDTARR